MPPCNLANGSSNGIRSRTLLRATAVLTLALGLAHGPTVSAAPAPPDNPFGQGGDSDSDDEGQAADEAKPPEGKAEGKREGAGKTAAEPGAPAEGSAEGSNDEEETETEGEGPAPESALHALTCLEGDATGGRRKGVQRRDFLKKNRFELSGLGGFYASDALSSTYSYGGSLAFFPSEDFGAEVLVTRSPVRFRLEEPFNAFDKEQHFAPGNAWQGIFSLLWSPIHAKFRFSEENIIHGDIFVVAGAGRTMHESVLGLTWEAGGGLKLYLWKYVSFRLDVRDFLLPQEVLGRGRMTNNVTILAGFGVWLG
jgi:outer membrane beta-barrel protein